jgi:RimJ/RimL family protein N-acetyltransferase
METESARLRLREFTSADIPNLFDLESRPDVVIYQEYETMTEKVAEKYVTGVVKAQSTTPRTVFDMVIELRDSQEFVGRVGMKVDHEKKHGDLWFSILPDMGGKGYATEAVRSLLTMLPDVRTLGIECDPRNSRSRKMAERLGFEKIRFQERAYECKGEWVGSVEYFKSLKSE